MTLLRKGRSFVESVARHVTRVDWRCVLDWQGLAKHSAEMNPETWQRAPFLDTEPQGQKDIKQREARDSW